jgi:hypothetical protein
MKMLRSTNFIIFSAIACIIACFGEFVFMFILGSYFPGYNQLKDTMSSLGASISPVSNQISLWWVIMGVLLIFFGIGIRMAFNNNRKHTNVASWLIILYGFGEGLGSGLFKANHTVTGVTNSAIIHDALGGIGVAAILVLPLFMVKVIPKNEAPGFYRMSRIIFVTGLLTVALFLFRYSSDPNNVLLVYKGLWQRLFMLNTYVYLTTIAAWIIKKQY